ncbi:translation machinery-associated protein 20 [Serendipita sp. 399]|nr:translation machinery-associated protein 20 [Serendipita sp. 399]
MFKKFSPATDVAGQTILKSSAQRTIRTSLLAQWQIDQDVLDTLIWPKKESLVLVKGRDHLSIYTLQGQPLFFQHFDGPFIPTLRLLHKCELLSQEGVVALTLDTTVPRILPALQVDRGAIRFLLAGANMMCPGFTSKGGQLPEPEAALPTGVVVSIEAEGKEHAAAIGITKLSTEEIKSVNKGIAVEIMTYLGDDLWTLETI